MEDARPSRPGLRASDADRQRLVTALERHTTAGRLSLDEYTERVDQVFQARTQGELAALLHDLPDEDGPGEDHPGDALAGARQLAFAFLLALLALVVIGIAVAAFR